MYLLTLNSDKQITGINYVTNGALGENAVEDISPIIVNKDRRIIDYRFIDNKIIYDPKPRPKYDPTSLSETEVLTGIVAALAMVTGHTEVLKNVKL